MSVRIEVFKPNAEMPSFQNFIDGIGIFSFFPMLEGVQRFGSDAQFESFLIYQRVNNLGVHVTVFTLDATKVVLGLLQYQPDYGQRISRLLANDKQTITDTKIELHISPGEAI